MIKSIDALADDENDQINPESNDNPGSSAEDEIIAVKPEAEAHPLSDAFFSLAF